MRTFEYAVIDELEIQARPAGMLVQEVRVCSGFDEKTRNTDLAIT